MDTALLLYRGRALARLGLPDAAIDVFTLALRRRKDRAETFCASCATSGRCSTIRSAARRRRGGSWSGSMPRIRGSKMCVNGWGWGMTGAADDPPALAGEVRALLSRRTPADPFLTYQAVATALGLTPPGTIQRVAAALEETMREDVAAGRPMIAALVISARATSPGEVSSISRSRWAGFRKIPGSTVRHGRPSARQSSGHRLRLPPERIGSDHLISNQRIAVCNSWS
ncbi:MAG: hypothetical protein JKP98_13160 [Rhodobacteraceae bacterium]|nr:hypothetical protein [Paracoccaceae bacterium]